MSQSNDEHSWEKMMRGGGNGRRPAPAVAPAESDAEDADEVSSSDEGKASSEKTSHVCVVCGYETHIDTPQITTDHFCQGDCGDWETFRRKDYYQDGDQ